MEEEEKASQMKTEKPASVSFWIIIIPNTSHIHILSYPSLIAKTYHRYALKRLQIKYCRILNENLKGWNIAPVLFLLKFIDYSRVIPKGQENLPPEVAIFASEYKYLAPLWKRRRKQVKRRLKSQLLWLLLGGVRIRREGEGGTVIAFPTERKLGSSNKI